MNVQEELSKLFAIRETISAILDFNRGNLIGHNPVDLIPMIEQVKREMLESLVPLDIHVVYKRMKVYQGGVTQEPIGFYLREHEADDIQDHEFDNNEDENLEFFVETETLE